VWQLLQSRGHHQQMRGVLRRARRSDVYLTAQEALEAGLGTHIGLPQTEIQYHVYMTVQPAQTGRQRTRSGALLPPCAAKCEESDG
jgi:hypothetical protein